MNSTVENADICGLCGLSGADKIPHPIHWPNEQLPNSEFVHRECEEQECRRAHSVLTPKEIIRFLNSL